MTATNSQMDTGHFDIEGIYVEYAKPVVNPDNGLKRPLVFVHGGCHGSWCWEHFLDYFSRAGRPCYALNWYNHYKSSPLPLEKFLMRSIGDVSEEIGILCSRLNEEPILIGHSMGGLAIQKFAERYPVAGLIMLAPGVPAGIGAEKNILPIPVDPNALFMPPPFELAKELFFQGLSDDEASRLYQNLCPESPRAVIEATEWTLPVDTAKLHCPMLIFAAELDLLVPPKTVKTLAEQYDADYYCLTGKGHSLPVEPGWRDTAKLIGEWLDRKIH